LLAARHTTSGKELVIEELRLQHVQRPQTWSIRDVTALEAFIDSADPSKLEGAVVCDSSFNRLKVKNKSWVLSSRMKDMVVASPRSALEAIIKGTIDDALPLVDEATATKMLKMQHELMLYCARVDENVDKFKFLASSSRKRFAEQVMQSGDWTAPYFNLWENRSRNTLEWIRSVCEKGKLSSSSLDTILSKLSLDKVS
jgi:hypothetical protein